MQKFEYKVFNMSEAKIHNEDLKKAGKFLNPLTWVDILNSHGQDGWRVVDRTNKTSYLLMREVLNGSEKSGPV